MKSELEIRKRRDTLKLEAQKISSQLNEVDAKLKEIPEAIRSEHLRIPLIKEKEGLHISLGLMNSRWVETLWMLDE